jgi:hypothetical protein
MVLDGNYISIIGSIKPDATKPERNFTLFREMEANSSDLRISLIALSNLRLPTIRGYQMEPKS